MTGTTRKVQQDQLDLADVGQALADTNSIPDATITDSGLMSATDKVKLDSLGGALTYKGVYDASTNIAPSPPGLTAGWFYIITVGGTYDGDTYVLGDWTVYNGTNWDKVDNTDTVVSVNGYTGAVTLTAADVGASATGHTHTEVGGVTVSGSSTPTLAVTGTTSVSGTNTGDQTITLTSDVTGSGTGSFATTIAANVVTNAKLATVATATFKGRTTAGTGNVEDLTATQATALLDVATGLLKGLMSSADFTKLAAITGTNTGDQTITLTSDVTGSGTGSFATTIAANVVTNAKLATVANATFKGRTTAGTGNVEDLTTTQATALLDVFVGGAAGAKGLVPTSTAQNVTDKAVLAADSTWAYPGKVIQVITGSVAQSSGSVQIPFDNTAPLNTEGFTIFGGQAITPKVSTSKFVITAPFWWDHQNNNRNITVAAFRNSTNTMTGATIIPGSVVVDNLATAGRPTAHTMQCEYSPGSTSTFYLFLVAGADGAGTTYINQGNGGARTMGGNGATTVKIEEVIP